MDLVFWADDAGLLDRLMTTALAAGERALDSDLSFISYRGEKIKTDSTWVKPIVLAWYIREALKKDTPDERLVSLLCEMMEIFGLESVMTQNLVSEFPRDKLSPKVSKVAEWSLIDDDGRNELIPFTLLA